MTKLTLNQIEWRNDSVTRRYLKRKGDKLLTPQNMTEGELCETITYCQSIKNPYAEELTRRAGTGEKFLSARTLHAKAEILRAAAISYGITLM